MSGRQTLPGSAVFAMVVMLAVSIAASAGPGGGGHAGGGGRSASGGWHGGAGGWHGGNGGWRGGNGGWHGGNGGWHGGYVPQGYGGYEAGHGWPGYGWRGGPWNWGWGLGVYVPFLPWYYATYWWNDVPFYYADGSYYTWDGDAGAYQAVEPPQGLSSVPPPGASTTANTPAGSPDLYVYPRNGQSEAQQKRDRDECTHWAATQTGLDSTQAMTATAAGTARQDTLRATAACLEARDYTVR